MVSYMERKGLPRQVLDWDRWDPGRSSPGSPWPFAHFQGFHITLRYFSNDIHISLKMAENTDALAPRVRFMIPIHPRSTNHWADLGIYVSCTDTDLSAFSVGGGSRCSLRACNQTHRAG